MMQNRCRAAILAGPTVCALVLLAGCESPRRNAAPTTEAPPQVQHKTPPGPAATVAPATAPSPPPAVALKPPPGPVLPTTQPVPEPIRPPEPPPAVPAEEEIPAYIQVVERIRPSEPAEVHVDASSPQRLVIDTHNVRRLRIDRERAPLLLNRSIVLRLDGQGIEWTADSRTREFERSVNGAWEAAHLRRP